MKTLILTSKKCIDTHIEFYFDEQERFCGYKIVGPSYNNTNEFVSGIYAEKPSLSAFQKIKGENYHIEEKLEEIYFEKFWIKYDNKIRSSKKRSQTAWNKLSKAEQIKAYNFIDKYVRNIPPNCEKKYCETYLKDELWNN